jgi:hypothetical protein
MTFRSSIKCSQFNIFHLCSNARRDLDAYWQSIIQIGKLVEFHKHHCSAELKTFLKVDEKIIAHKSGIKVCTYTPQLMLLISPRYRLIVALHWCVLFSFLRLFLTCPSGDGPRSLLPSRGGGRVGARPAAAHATPGIQHEVGGGDDMSGRGCILFDMQDLYMWM